MKKTEILAYLDNLVDEHKHYYETQNEKNNVGIILCSNKEIHVFDGIHILAAAAEATLERSPFSAGDDSSPAYRYSFAYKNVKLFQLDDDEGFPEVAWDE